MSSVFIRQSSIGECSKSDRRTASALAAQQVISSLLDSRLLSGPQKLVRFINCAWVRVASQDFPYAIGVSAQFVNNVRVRDALNMHHVNGNSFGARECSALLGYDVQRHSGNGVSFEWGFSPKQVCHVQISFAYMVGRIAMGVSGISPAIQWCCTSLEKGAAAFSGAMFPRHRLAYSHHPKEAATNQANTPDLSVDSAVKSVRKTLLPVCFPQQSPNMLIIRLSALAAKTRTTGNSLTICERARELSGWVIRGRNACALVKEAIA